MIRSLAELCMHEGSKVERAAVVSDLRGGEVFGGLAGILDELRAEDVSFRLVFLLADEQTLLNRYKETRRRHPLATHGTVVDGIRREQELLAPIRERADVSIDTSGLTAGMLRRKVADELLEPEAPGKLSITFTSFGHKHGPPRDADLAFDVRFLPNPHYEPDLRPLTGLRRPHRRLRGARRAPRAVLRARGPAAGLPRPAVRRRRARRTSSSPSAARAAATAPWSSPSISPPTSARAATRSSRSSTATSTARPRCRSRDLEVGPRGVPPAEPRFEGSGSGWPGEQNVEIGRAGPDSTKWSYSDTRRDRVQGPRISTF